ncbi:MAG: translocation/assembly module TamB domain-containing protein [Prevotella sp.]|nr:translocation/assembly module TamB domain-containing protein [Prevotella sp.]
MHFGSSSVTTSFKNPKNIKHIRRLISITLWLLLGTAVLVYASLHIPYVQRKIGEHTARAIGEKLGTEVEVGRVDIGFLNRVIIDDVSIYDQSGEEALCASRLSAKVNLPSLFRGKVSVTSAQVFGLRAMLYKTDGDSPLNIQFALDSLASSDSTSHHPLDLDIHSLVIRHGTVRYDRRDITHTPGRLSPHHLHFTNISGHLALDHLTDDEAHLRIKDLSLHEVSGLDLQRLTLKLDADKRHTTISRLHATLPGSVLHADTLETHYTLVEGKPDPSTVRYRIHLNELNLTPSDLRFAHPAFAHLENPIHLSTRLSGSRELLDVETVQLRMGEQLTLNASGQATSLDKDPHWLAHVNHLDTHAETLQHLLGAFGSKTTLPTIVNRMGHITYSGDLGTTGDEHAIMGDLGTDHGSATLALHLKGQHFSGRVETDDLHLGNLLDDTRLGMVSTAIDLDGQLPLTKAMTLNAKGDVTRLDFNGHTYNNIHVDGSYDQETLTGTLDLDDPFGQLTLDGTLHLASTPSGTLTASAHHFNPEGLGLTTSLAGQTLDFDLRAKLSGTTLSDLSGTLDIEQLHVEGPGKNLHLSSLHIDTGQQNGTQHLDVHTDFGQATLSGHYDYALLADAFTNIIHHHLPSLNLLPHHATPGDTRLSFSADIEHTDWLRQFIDTDLALNAPLHVEGMLDEKLNHIELNAQSASLQYGGSTYNDAELQLLTLGDTLHANAAVIRQQDEDKRLDLALQAEAYDDQLSTRLGFDTHGNKQRLHGMVAATTRLANGSNGLTAMVNTTPSQVYLNDIAWNITPSHLTLARNHIHIDHFTIENAGQHIIVSGSLTDNATDTIHANLKELDAAFLSGILHVKGLDFGGKISGDAFVTSVFDTPSAEALLFIDHFTFNDGRMGDMDVTARWNARDNRIDIDALALDGTEGRTKIDGYVNLSPGEINLDVAADGTPLHFLERYVGSFIDNVEARIDGHVRVFGPLSGVNLEGKVVANGDVSFKSLNTHYTMMDDTVLVVPDHIIFLNDTIADLEGHRGLLTGSVDHHNLSRFTFDLGIRSYNLLCYDFKEFGENTFCGTVHATGDCHIKGVSGETTIEVNATTDKNTVFYYNAASPDALSNQDFITWNDITPQALDFSELPTASGQATTPQATTTKERPVEPDIPSNLRMTFNITATPDANLRLLMDEGSGDYISLFGSGTLRASYFNKGAFNLYGNYLVDHGTYKLTIQNVIKKEFQFQQGGTITFGGNPYDAALHLKAVYVANSVPLSDLSIGRSFSTNNIRVNCVMNIEGTPNQPTVDFDLEMPTVNSDAEQMVRSVINSEEELNQQVIYLLTIGRFYNQDADAENETGQSQTSLAMQSLLSGTISQQINSVLSNVIKSNNWNFGANISTGDEGWNNAEYEGLLSGRLLNNRLQFNGQFGYRDNPNATTSFIGDFDIQYLLFPNGNLAVKVYNQTNDRYFIKNSLNTQGIGLIMKKDFNGWRELVGLDNRKRKKEKKQQP